MCLKCIFLPLLSTPNQYADNVDESKCLAMHSKNLHLKGKDLGVPSLKRMGGAWPYGMYISPVTPSKDKS